MSTALIPTTAFNVFISRCRALGLSEDTIRWYRARLGKFLAKRESIETINAQEIRAHLVELSEAGIAPGTIRRTHGALRCFFGFLVEDGLIDRSPMQSVRKPKAIRTEIEALSVDQCRRVLDVIDKTTIRGLRLWTMTALFLDTGVRLTELLSLRRDQINISEQRFRVLGKGRKERTVPFGARGKQALVSYLAREAGCRSTLLFVDRRGKQLTRTHIGREYWFLSQRLGFKVRAHMLRHTFATQYLLNGGDTRSLQQILGHADMSMLQVYIRFTDEQLSGQHSRFSPLDRLADRSERKEIVNAASS